MTKPKSPWSNLKDRPIVPDEPKSPIDSAESSEKLKVHKTYRVLGDERVTEYEIKGSSNEEKSLHRAVVVTMAEGFFKKLTENIEILESMPEGLREEITKELLAIKQLSFNRLKPIERNIVCMAIVEAMQMAKREVSKIVGEEE